MAKRELIDRNNLEITPIATDDYSGNKVIATVLLEDVEKAPVITEQDIVKPYLEKIRAEIAEYGSIMVAYAITKDTKTNKGIEKLVSDVLKQAKEQVLEIIDKYKAESEEWVNFADDLIPIIDGTKEQENGNDD